MRATSMQRLAGGSAALLLAGATMLGAGSALAGETRLLDIQFATQVDSGAPFTKVSTGGVTKTDITVTNNGKQTLTKAHLLIGGPDGIALPAGFSVALVYDLKGSGTCSNSTATVDCDFGSLTSRGPGATRTVSIAFGVGSTTGDVTATIKVSENVQDVGSNSNFRRVTATAVVDDASCDALATFLLPGHGQTLLDPTAKCISTDQKSKITIPAGSNALPASIGNSAVGTCPTGYTCFGKQVDASVDSGATVSPYLTWEINYPASVMARVNVKQVSFDHNGFIIQAGRRGACGASFANKDCLVRYQVETDGSVTFVLWTTGNGAMKGLG